MILPSWERSHIPYQSTFEDNSPSFPQVGYVTLPKTKSSPLKIDLPTRKVIFQPSIFGAKMLVSGRVIFLFPRWDMLVPWMVEVTTAVLMHASHVPLELNTDCLV